MPSEMLPLAYYALGALVTVIAMKYAVRLYLHSSADLLEIRQGKEGLYEIDLLRDGVPISVVGSGKEWRLAETEQPLTPFLRGTVYALWLRNYKKALPSK